MRRLDLLDPGGRGEVKTQSQFYDGANNRRFCDAGALKGGKFPGEFEPPPWIGFPKICAGPSQSYSLSLGLKSSPDRSFFRDGFVASVVTENKRGREAVYYL